MIMVSFNGKNILNFWILLTSLFTIWNIKILNLTTLLIGDVVTTTTTTTPTPTNYDPFYSTANNGQQQSPPSLLRKSRVIMGIFSADIQYETRYRDAFRDLLYQAYPKVCSLNEYMINPTMFPDCELLYTFVVGGNTSSTAPTELVTSSTARPITIPPSQIPEMTVNSSDFHQTDFTFLNIRENMDEGKSQTWFYYCSNYVMNKYTIDYVMKIDTDSLIYLDRYFHFADTSLPPSPYNVRIMAGKPVDKLWWKKRPILSHREILFKQQYSTFHFYTAGQMYILSQDLASGIANVAANHPYAKYYMEGPEDHDITLLAFMSIHNHTTTTTTSTITASSNNNHNNDNLLRQRKLQNSNTTTIEQQQQQQQQRDNTEEETEDDDEIDHQDQNQEQQQQQQQQKSLSSSSSSSSSSTSTTTIITNKVLYHTTDTPIKFIMIPVNDPWWYHPLKIKYGIGKWKQKWDDEIDRIQSIYNNNNNNNNSHNDNSNRNSNMNKKSTPSTLIPNYPNLSNNNNQLITSDQSISTTTKIINNNEWTEMIVKQQFTDLSQYIHTKNYIDINNTIASSNSCFLTKPDNTIMTNNNYRYHDSLNQSLRIIEFTADGGMYWSEFMKLIQSKLGSSSYNANEDKDDDDDDNDNDTMTTTINNNYVDIIILNRMNLHISKKEYNYNKIIYHPTQLLANALSMNYIWGMEYMNLTSINNTNIINFKTTEDNDDNDDYYTFSGQAILSKCQLYDPYIVRNKQPDNEWKATDAVGGKIGLFVRTGNYNSNDNNVTTVNNSHNHNNNSNHIVVGSLRKLSNISYHRSEIWHYQFGMNTTNFITVRNRYGMTNIMQGISPRDQFGIIIGGNLPRQTCSALGLSNIDRRNDSKGNKYATWPSNCIDKTLGRERYDNFCGNFYNDYRNDHTILPCYYPKKRSSEHIQVSSHAIISILVK